MPAQHLIAAFIAVALPSVALAQDDGDVMGEHYRMAYADWTGLVLHCTGQGDLTEQVCKKIEDEVTFLAQSSGVGLAIAGSYGAATAEQLENSRLQLTVEVTTQAADDFGLVSAAVRAEASYRAAVESEADESDPRAVARPGSLVFWHDGAAGAGPTDEAIAAVVGNLGGSLRGFFSDFVAARR